MACFKRSDKESSLLGVAGKRRFFTLGEVLNFEDARSPFARSVKTNQKISNRRRLAAKNFT